MRSQSIRLKKPSILHESMRQIRIEHMLENIVQNIKID